MNRESASLLLTTRLHPPSVRDRSRVVSRPRLIARLNDALRLACPLVLLSAPAGSGKTTLLGDWIAQHQGLVAWLSLDEGDNDPARFWTYFLAALQTVEPDLGESARALLRGTEQSLRLESFLTLLLNELAASPDQLVIVLDDYHVISAPVIHEGLGFLLDHLPPAKHVVIATRADPPLPLARLRAGNLVAEFRADDLHFTPDEAAEFLNRVIGLDLSADEIAALEARTEGWTAGLHLAAFSLRGRDEAARRRFILAFTGSQRYILDYLVEEVLQRRPEPTQTFLLRTSILDRLSGPLADAVTGRADGQAMLEELERANLFLIALDEERRWYRYHSLFAEVLRHRLRQAEPDHLPELHRRAASWSAEHGLIEDAVRHALAAGDALWAARLVERHAEEVLRRGEGETLRRRLSALPEAVVRSRPRLALAQAIAAFNAGRLRAAASLLDDAERAIASGPPEPYEPSAGRELSMLANVPATIVLLRAAIAGLRGDAGRLLELVRLAQGHVGEDEQGPRISIRWNLALGDLMHGRLSEAERAFADLVAEGRSHGQPHLTLSAGALLARVQRAQGRLDAALRTYREGLDFASRTDSPETPSAAMAHLGMAEVFYERDQLEQALHSTSEGIPLAKQLTSTQTLATGLATLARIRQARGDPAAAREAMDEAYRLVPAPEIVSLHNPVPAERARLLLAQGDLLEAVRWVEARGLGAEDEPAYAREREHLVLARVLLARDRGDRALGLLARLATAAAAQARTESLIEIRLLEALAFEAIGDGERAVAALVEALALARPEGYVRLFLDEGAPLAALLRRVTVEQRPDAERLLAALHPPAPASPPSPAGARPSALVEPLTERELHVLHLLAEGLSNREIARTLYLSVGTVKVHLKHIYGKLEVHNRTQAVARARELGLL